MSNQDNIHGRSDHHNTVVETVRGILAIPMISTMIRAGVVLLCLYMYYNQLDKRDIYTILTVIFSDFGLQIAKRD